MSPARVRPVTGPLPSAATLEQAIDALGWPLLLLREDATLLHANRAAHQLLRRGQPLGLSPLHQVQPADTRRRGDFAQALLKAAAGGGPALLHWPVATNGAKKSAAFWARLTALPNEDGSADADADVAIPRATLLLALGPGADRGADLQAYAAQHGLSATETRVLQRLAPGDLVHALATLPPLAPLVPPGREGE